MKLNTLKNCSLEVSSFTKTLLRVIVQKLGQWLLKTGILISLFAVDFRKVPKHYFVNLNTDECVSTVPIKNGSILYFNHL